MTTYLINHLRIPGGLPREEGLSYLERVESTVERYGGKWLAMGEVQVLEGAWPGSVVLMEFPSHAAAEAWYRSPEYQEILPLRTRTAISDLILVDEVGRGFTVAGLASQLRGKVVGLRDQYQGVMDGLDGLPDGRVSGEVYDERQGRAAAQ